MKYHIAFSQTTDEYYASFDLTADTLSEAREMAEQFVEDGEADTADIRNDDWTVSLSYDGHGWTDESEIEVDYDELFGLKGEQPDPRD